MTTLLSTALGALHLAGLTYSAALPSDLGLQARAAGVFVAETFFPDWRKDDQFYNVNMTFNGQTLPVLLDTGSGDLFIASDECNVVNQNSGCYLSKTYQIKKTDHLLKNVTFGTVVGTGGVSGYSSLLEVSVGGRKAFSSFGVPLINSADADEFQDGTFSGVLGVAPRNVSRTWYFNQQLPFVDSLIAAGNLVKPMFSISLPRFGDDTATKGYLTLGGVEKLPAGSKLSYNDIIDNLNYNYGEGIYAPQSWTAELQAINVNGKNITVGKGDIDPAGRYLSLMDTGAQQMLFRRDQLYQIFQAFVGTTIIQGNTSIYFDCSQPQNIQLKYHDQWFPVDPLDMIIPSNHGLVNGTQMCLAALGAWDRTFADSIIGVPFLRNVVSVFDYVSNDLYSVQPRLGLASKTNAAKAEARYSTAYKARLS